MSQFSPNVLALVTARGGSKGLPGKNLRPLAGKPLIAWSIEAAKVSRFTRRVVVSTDDQPIADVARQWGADVPFMRPPELARDDTPHLPVIIHAVTWLEDNEAEVFDYILLLQPTSPLRSAEDIDSAIRLAYEKNAESVASVSEALSHPYLCKTIGSHGELSPFITPPTGLDLRRQNLPKAYALNGALYLTRRDVLLEGKRIHGETALAYVMPFERSLDIDDELDFQIAEYLVGGAQVRS